MPAPRQKGRSRINSRATGQHNRLPSWTQLIDEFIEHKEKCHLSGNTIIYYRYRMQSWVDFLEAEDHDESPEDVTAETILDWTSWVRRVKHCNANTARHGFITLRAFYNWLIKHRKWQGENPVIDAEEPLVVEKIIETFTPEQLQTLIADCDSDKDFYGLRDKAAILLLLDTGLRASECCDINLNDINWDNQTILVLAGKGRKQRIVPFAHSVFIALRAYLRVRPDLPHDYVFVNHFGERLDRDRLRELILRRGKRAKIVGVRLSPHTFRHTFAVQYLLNGGDAFSLQTILGHSTAEMTKRYVHFAQGMLNIIQHRVSPADTIAPQIGPGRKRIGVATAKGKSRSGGRR